MRNKYIKTPSQFVVAVQVALNTEGFSYQKWGSVQQCRPNDWLVQNGDDIYTIDKDTFASTYRKVEEGKYVKTVPVWAEVATESGTVATTSGTTAYNAGDYLVCNKEDGGDAYAMSSEKFEAMYELA